MQTILPQKVRTQSKTSGDDITEQVTPKPLHHSETQNSVLQILSFRQIPAHQSRPVTITTTTIAHQSLY